MSKKHIWRIKDQYYRQHKEGTKDIEIRVGYDSIKQVRQGDIIVFENHDSDCFYVERISHYNSFQEMLQKENPKRIIPDATTTEVLSRLRKIYPRSKEKLGVYAFKLRLENRNPKKFDLFSASAVLKQKQHVEFSQIIGECYRITDWISQDYPGHCESFYTKYVPGVFTGSREIIGYRIGTKVIAVAFLKKSLEATPDGPGGHSEMERKLSTLYVDPEHRNQGLAARLLQECFKWLGTTKPLATIAEYKLEQFAGIIKKYGWEEKQILEKGYYNDHTREHVFNGKI